MPLTFRTRYEIIFEHNLPLDPEKLGQMVSNAIEPIGEHKIFHGNLKRTVTSILAHNVPHA
jgi:hypothetical protein